LEFGGRAMIETRPFVEEQTETFYTLYGQLVRSDVPLPVRSQSSEISWVDWTFRRRGDAPSDPATRSEVARLRCRDHGNTIAVRYQSNQGTWIFNPFTAEFLISADGTSVDIFEEEPYDGQLLAFTLISEISVFLLQMRGWPTLHASAVSTPEGAIVFAGRAGQGKSTIAASCLRRGLPLLADDNLPLNMVNGVVLGGPSVPIMKVLADTAEDALQVPHDAECLTWGKKQIVSIDTVGDYATQPVALRAIYVLNRYDPHESQRSDIRITPLSDGAALNTLLAQTAYGTLFLPGEVGRFLPLYAKLIRQAPIRILTYPHGFEHIDAVCDQILTDIAAS